MGRFAQGKYNLKNPEKYLGNKTPTYRSSWEFAFMRFCDEHPSVENWASEAIQIPYRNPLTGKQTIYVPDFFIQYAGKDSKKRVELIEVKPDNQTTRESLGNSRANQAHWVINQAKWEAARAWCKQKGIFFRVITENDIFHQGKRR
jgi:hypothetical protein